MIKPKVLLISDNKQIREIVTSAFSETEVFFATSFEDALSILELEYNITSVVIDFTRKSLETIIIYAKIKLIFDSFKVLVIVNKSTAEEFQGIGIKDDKYCVYPCDTGKLYVWARTFLQEPLGVDTTRSLWERLFTKSPTGFAIIQNNDPQKSTFNPAFKKIIGYDPHDIVGAGWWAITHPGDVEFERSEFDRIFKEDKRSFDIEKRIILPDDTIRWVYLNYNVIEYIPKKSFTTLIIASDITKFKSVEHDLKETEASRQRIVQNLPGVVYRCKNDDDYTMVFISDMIQKLTGWAPSDLINNKTLPFSDIIANKHKKEVREKWNLAIETKTMFRHQYEVLTKSGKRKWVLEQGEAIYDPDGTVRELEGILVDISDIKKIEKVNRYKRLYNEETKLPNRRSFINDLKDGISQNKTHTFMTINLSDTKRTGTIHGHEYYMNLRNIFAEKIKEIPLPRTKIYLTQEDHFTLHFRSHLTKEQIEEIYYIIIDNILGTLRRETVRCGIGVTFASGTDNKNELGERILKRALMASESAQFKSGLVSLKYYTNELEGSIIREDLLVQELRALMRSHDFGGLKLHYQPVYEVKTDKVIGYEALARYTSPQFGYINPVELIGIAEKHRFSVVLGLKIFRLAFSFLARLKKEGYGNKVISVNVSTTQLLDTMLADKLDKMATEFDIPLKNVVLELTEHVYADNFEKLNESIESLRQHGIRLAIDDFGTGYSSLSLIQDLDIWSIKVDRTFISKLNKENESSSIAREIISMCHKLVDVVVGEGVETSEQYELLKAYNCDYAQGYYLARPMPEDDALLHLKQKQ